MGTFLGHVLPGAALLTWGVYWAFHAFCGLNYNNSHQSRKKSSLPPLEPTVRLVVIVAHAAAEVAAGVDGLGVQHVAMVGGFLVPTAMDIMVHYGVRGALIWCKNEYHLKYILILNVFC